MFKPSVVNGETGVKAITTCKLKNMQPLYFTIQVDKEKQKEKINVMYLLIISKTKSYLNSLSYLVKVCINRSEIYTKLAERKKNE